MGLKLPKKKTTKVESKKAAKRKATVQKKARAKSKPKLKLVKKTKTVAKRESRSDDTKSKFLHIRISPEKVEQYKRIAAKDNRSMSNWVEQTLDRAVAKGAR